MAKALGMNYPIQLGQQGYFEQTFDSFTNEEVKLINLMHTNVGERVMQPDFGLGLEKYLFENITPQLNTQIEKSIRSKISYWLPNITINSLTVTTEAKTDADRNIIYVTINFSLVSDPTQYDEITFRFE
jgi:phage baseplate assembly protein W